MNQAASEVSQLLTKYGAQRVLQEFIDALDEEGLKQDDYVLRLQANLQTSLNEYKGRNDGC